VPGEYELVGLAVGVVVRDAEDVLALLAVDVDGVFAVVEGGGFAAARGVGALGEDIEIFRW